MIITTIDPISGNKVDNLNASPSIIEGNGYAETKIHFESSSNMYEYLDFSSTYSPVKIQHPTG